jgi:hypothetical protein
VYFDNEKEYCNLCSDVVDSETYLENEGFCDDCKKCAETCDECGDYFHIGEMINHMCENCYDLYRDELHEEDYF